MRALCSLLCLIALTSAVAAKTGDPKQVMADLEKYIQKEESVSGEHIRDEIDLCPAAVAAALLPRIRDSKTGEKELIVYLWAAGLTNDPILVKDIIARCKTHSSMAVKTNGYRALAQIGGEDAGKFLYSEFKKAKSKEDQYAILDFLAEAHYQPAVPDMVKYLIGNPNQAYWQAYFLFGKAGDAAVPELLRCLGDKDKNVRGMSITMLADWLIPAQANEPLRKAYWAEPDPELRAGIMGAIERVSPSMKSLREFATDVVAKEKDESAKKFAQETLEHQPNFIKKMHEAAAKKKPSAGKFNAEYTRLMKSAGKEGDYDVLEASSTFADEQKLIELRQRILDRNSDECWSDYCEVNEIIMYNRYLKSGTE